MIRVVMNAATGTDILVPTADVGAADVVVLWSIAGLQTSTGLAVVVQDDTGGDVQFVTAVSLATGMPSTIEGPERKGKRQPLCWSTQGESLEVVWGAALGYGTFFLEIVPSAQVGVEFE